MFSLARISTTRSFVVFRHYSSVAVKLWHRSDFNRLKNGGMAMPSENVLTKLTSKDGMSTTFPTATIPTRLQVTVPRNNYNSIVVFNQHFLEEGTFRKHFVGAKAYSENMLQYFAKATDEPEPPQGEQGFLWRLTRPLEAFKKRFMGNEDFAQDAKEKVEPIKATHETTPQQEIRPKGPASPPKSP